MNKRREKIAYNYFYHEFDMMDKFLYIKRVMDSCKTHDQLDIAYKWGNDALWKFYDVFYKKYKDKYGFCEWLDIQEYFFSRTCKITRELLAYSTKLLKVG